MKHRRRTRATKHAHIRKQVHTHTHQHAKTMKGHDKKFIVMSMVVVGAGLVLGLVVLAPWQAAPPGMPDLKFEKFTPPPVYFVQGAPLPEGFPEDLILEKNVALEVAVVSPDAASTPGLSTSTRNMIGRQTVRWTSRASVDALSAAYEDYFSKNGWMVASKSESPDGKSRATHATKGAASATISLSPRPDGAVATVGYKAQ